jgi:hypothetical protein
MNPEMNPGASRGEAYKDSLRARLHGRLAEVDLEWSTLAEKKDQGAIERAFLEYNDIQDLMDTDSRASNAMKGALGKLAKGLLRETLKRIQ